MDIKTDDGQRVTRSNREIYKKVTKSYNGVCHKYLMTKRKRLQYLDCKIGGKHNKLVYQESDASNKGSINQKKWTTSRTDKSGVEWYRSRIWTDQRKSTDNKTK